MPAKVKVRILAGRNLPVMDKSSDASDAFVEVKLGNTTYKTEVYRRSLNPFWNSEWFRFEVSDQELQDEPLQIRIMDYDTYSANDAIGKVYINLNPLLVNPGRSMNGWLPIYDTMHGIRGEINCMVKVNLFTDNNRFRQSSCGVRFFFADIPNGYKCDAILGFVDELLVNDDPEYQWIDKIRTPRASNEARQTLFTKLSGEVQRKLGLKAEIFGGNAVIGYNQSFDLEGGSGIVGRGIGTAVVLSKIGSDQISIKHTSRFLRSPDSSTGAQAKSRKPFRPMTHSISVDHFYPASSKFRPEKKLSNAIEPFKLAKSVDISESSDNETFVSLHSDDEYPEGIQSSLTDLSDDNHDKELHSSISTLTSDQTKYSLSAFKRTLVDLTESNQRKDSVDLPRSTKIVTMLRQSNKSLSRKLSSALPIKGTSALRLIKSLSIARKKTEDRLQVDSHNSKSSTVPAQVESEDPQASSTQDRCASTTTSSGQPISMEQKSVACTEHTTESLAPTTSSGHKRRREKSQTASSVEETLSTIDEKFDDDENSHLHPSKNQNRARTASASSAKHKRPTFVRTSEIDLSGENDALSNVDPKLPSTSAGEYCDDEDDPTDITDGPTSSSANSKMARATTRSDSIVSTSSQSTVVSTDETIRECKQIRTNLHSSDRFVPASTPTSSQSVLKRSDTDVNHLKADKRKQQSSSEHQLIQLNRSESARVKTPTGSASMRRSSVSKQQRKQAGGGEFVQSVSAIKAQQHLLQTMIRHQNQNLLVASMNKAKTAFMYPGRIHQGEYPFVTLKRYPEGLVQCIGGVVAAHSVKLLDHIMNDEESETRDIWWTELRKEIRSHSKALNCNTILGYSESSKVLGDVCILSAHGTAAIMNSSAATRTLASPEPGKTSTRVASSNTPTPRSHELISPQTSNQKSSLVKSTRSSTSPQPFSEAPISRTSSFNAERNTFTTSGVATNEESCRTSPINHRNKSLEDAAEEGNSNGLIDCSFCHTPLTCIESAKSLPDCTICKEHKVPDILMLTIEPPTVLNIASHGTLVQARVCRPKRDSHGEASAKEIGDALPFLEYELHRQLMSKLKFKGMNCLFNLTIDMAVGENMITGLATGTGCYVLGLPTPEAPKIIAGKGIKTSKLSEIQQLIALSAKKNRELLGLDAIHLQLAQYHERISAKKLLIEDSLDELQNDSEPELDKVIDESKPVTESQVSSEQTDGTLSAPNASLMKPIDLDSQATSGRESRGEKLITRSVTKLQATNVDAFRERSNTEPKYHHKHHRIYTRNHYHHDHHHRHHHRHHHHHHHHHHHRHHHRKSPKLEDGRQTAVPAENLINLLGDENNIVLEVDDNEDADIIALLIDNDIPNGYFVCSGESVPTICSKSIASINMFTQMMRVKLTSTDQFAQQFDWIIQALFVKLRRSLPCCLTNLNFIVDLPEPHIVQITLTGCLLGLPPVGMNQLASSGANTPLANSIHSHELSAPLDPGRSPQRQSGNKSVGKDKSENNNVKRKNLLSHSSTSMSPTSLSTSSRMSSASESSSSSSSNAINDRKKPTSSTTSSNKSSSISDGESTISRPKSNATADQSATANLSVPEAEDQASSQTNRLSGSSVTKSLTKQLSKTNLAALISAVSRSTSFSIGFNSDKNEPKVDENETLEMSTTSASAPISLTPDATRASLAAFKQDIGQNKCLETFENLEAQPARRSFRTVFKKQQTYPGAISPSISGQDNNQAQIQRDEPDANQMSNNNTLMGRKATQLLNRVKQPLKELGTNFSNVSTPSGATSQSSSRKDAEKTARHVGGSTDNDNNTNNSTGTKSKNSRSLGIRSSAQSPSGPAIATNVVRSSSMSISRANETSFGASLDPKQQSGADLGERLVRSATSKFLGRSSCINSSIDITSLSYIPGAREYQYLGNLSFSFVRETTSVRENGGLNAFIHCFLMEVYAIVRAHVSALGGNAVLSFRLQQSSILYHSNKNQAQCLISVAGDAVQVIL